MKIALVVSQFHPMITTKMLEEAGRALAEEKLAPEDIEIFYTSGSFEIPATAQKIIDTKKFDGIIALGCVIRGETNHYDFVCQGVTQGIQKVAIENRFPITFGILTVNTVEQAMARVKKGYDCAKGVLAMIDLFKKIG